MNFYCITAWPYEQGKTCVSDNWPRGNTEGTTEGAARGTACSWSHWFVTFFCKNDKIYFGCFKMEVLITIMRQSCDILTV